MAAAKPGEQRALKHCAYSKFFTAEEIKLGSATEIGFVDAELRLTRVRLIRMLKAEVQQEKDQAELYELQTEGVSGSVAPLFERKRFKRTNYHDIFDRLMARIESLERTRMELAKVARAEELGSPEKDVPITNIRIEVVGGKNVTAHHDGAAGEVLPAQE